ncbi:Hypothetical protein NGAL_HAMBI1146_15900 [Neorhizobium galegae bv. officinalis]|nr:Hypothetical protein NGAL_HAMBI1146_15900 [Neorhizobium galegae bv. officinalis]
MISALASFFTRVESSPLPALALWYQRSERQPVAGVRPALELHVNLWRRSGRSTRRHDINYLDLGVEVHEPRDLVGLHLYVPFSLGESPVEDLGASLRQREIASAVFNEVLEVHDNPSDGRSFFIRKGDRHFLTVHPVQVDDASLVKASDYGAGALISFLPDFCAKLQNQGRHYLRLRFKLSPRAAAIFSSNVSSEDGFLLSSISTSEITEIRINEARSIPEAVQKRASEGSWLSPQITAIHYFLVRDISFDLVASHASFRKIRRMEPEWDAYLGKDFPDGSARNMLIYHWRKAATDRADDVGDFVTLAKFRRSTANVWLYLFLVVLLGGLGSGLHASLSYGLGYLVSPASSVIYATLVILCGTALITAFKFRRHWSRS